MSDTIWIGCRRVLAKDERATTPGSVVRTCMRCLVAVHCSPSSLQIMARRPEAQLCCMECAADIERAQLALGEPLLFAQPTAEQDVETLREIGLSQTEILTALGIPLAKIDKPQ